MTMMTADMVPILAYLLDAAHFPEADPEGMFIAQMRVFLPWTAAALARWR